MFNKVFEWVASRLGDGADAVIAASAIFFVASVACAGVVYFLLKIIFSTLRKKSKSEITANLAKFSLRRKIPLKISGLVFFYACTYIAKAAYSASDTLVNILVVMMLICLAAIISAMLDVVHDFYKTKSRSASHPIKSVIQVIKIALCIIIVIIAISLLLDQNPLVLISGVSAFAAILAIVFKDALLGLVAGVEIASEDLLHLGDWIVIPARGIEGAVTDIGLITVKIKTYDNLVMSVPAYDFLSYPFKNYRQTVNDAERQISKTVFVDAENIRTLSSREASTFVSLNKDVFSKESEDLSVFCIDGVTNLSLYRAYMQLTLKQNDHIKKDFSLVVKTDGNDAGTGIPVTIYCTCDIADYDAFQEFGSQICERAFASLSAFGLKPYKR